MPSPATPIAVEARSLRKQFGNTVAVDGISFQVRQGECFGLLGPNGAGKSSTFRMLCCVSPISGGKLLVLGLDARKQQRDIKAQLGVAPQDNNLDPELSVWENLLVYARYFDLPLATAKLQAEQALTLFQLQDKRNDQVQSLSGGMKRRLVLARTLVNQPRLLVLDEPTTGLDPQARRIIWQTVRQLQTQGVTIMLSTHYMDEAAALCDRIAIINHGRILAEDSPAALVQQYAGAEVLEVLLGTMTRADVERGLTPGMTLQDLGDRVLLLGPDVRVHRSVVEALGLVAIARPATLEDVFIRLTGSGLQDEP